MENINYPVVIAAFIAAIILIVWLIRRNCRVFFQRVYRDNILAKGGLFSLKSSYFKYFRFEGLER
jgi:hypothetical protein